MLAVSRTILDEMVAHAYNCYPEEACGLLVGNTNRDHALRFIACENISHSAKVYTIEPKVLLRAERDAEDAGLELIGVMHSHTHTEPYPSVTDVEQAPDPTWHYVIVSLKREAPETRSYLLREGAIAEEQISVS